MEEHLNELQYKDKVDPEGDLYPLYLYIYDFDGHHRNSIRLNNKVMLNYALRGSIKIAINQKREVRITDTGDLLCFHSQGGAILYNGLKTL